MKVQIPSSTSNLGPGFDTLGLALNRYLYLSADFVDGGRLSPRIVVEGNGKEHIRTDESNLVYRGMMALAKNKRGSSVRLMKNLELHLKNEIPSYGGLGGSGAAIVGGVFLANEMLGTQLSREELLNIAVSVEGHPDNVSAALMGGLTVNCYDNGRLRCRSIKIGPQLSVVACIPQFQLLTEDARAILPREVPLKDAILNVEYSSSLVAAFMSGDFEALRYATQDRLHEQYRSKLIPGYGEVRSAALSAGALSFNISGAGPAVFTFATSRQSEIGKAMVKAFSEKGMASTYVIMSVENEGAQVVT